MSSLVLLIIGVLIIFISIIFIARQSNLNNENESEELLQNDDELIVTIESLENIIDDINHTFNSTINEIEKKYELLESKITDVDKKVLEKSEQEVTTSFQKDYNYENNFKNNIDDKEEFKVKKEYLMNNRSSEIIELKNRGLNVQQIARELNIGTGEVILILNLMKTRN